MTETDSNVIDLDKLSFEQLNQLKAQQESRLQMITSRFAELRAAHARFEGAKEALKDLRTADNMTNHHDTNGGTEIMVPLTPSLYVPGRIKDPNNLMVDLGTGFYVEKTSKAAVAFVERKIKLIDANTANMMKIIQATRQNAESINIAMQGKLLEIRARQEGMRARAEGAN